MKTRNVNMTYSPAPIILNVFCRVVNASNSVSPPIRSMVTFVNVVKNKMKNATKKTLKFIPPFLTCIDSICFNVIFIHLRDSPPLGYLEGRI